MKRGKMYLLRFSQVLERKAFIRMRVCVRTCDCCPELFQTRSSIFACNTARPTNAGSELERKKDVRGRHSANISIVSGPSFSPLLLHTFSLSLSFSFSRVIFAIHHSRFVYARVHTLNTHRVLNVRRANGVATSLKNWGKSRKDRGVSKGEKLRRNCEGIFEFLKRNPEQNRLMIIADILLGLQLAGF